MRAFRTAFVLACLFVASPSSAEIDVDLDSAAAQGFEIVDMVRDTHDPAFAEWLDRDLVAPWMAEVAPGAAYGFSWWQGDLNNDGLGDVVVSIRTAAQISDGNGAPVIVALKIGRGWMRIDESSAMYVGIRELASGELQVGYLDDRGIRLINED